MADSSTPRDPFEAFVSLVSGPIAAVIRSFDQLRKGADELLKGLENFNRTMSNLNETAERVNALLNELEEPARTIVPQVARTVTLAEDLATRMAGPIDQVVPGLTRLADTLSAPVIATLPAELTKFVDTINDLVHRMSPLAQLAESAGGMFGLRVPALARNQSGPTPTVEPAPAPPPVKKATKKTAAKKTTKKKSSST